jgi:hypothetical protein
MRLATLLAPASLAVLMPAACTSGSTAVAVLACGPDSVATTNSDVVIVNDYEAALYYASVDAIPVTFYEPPLVSGDLATLSADAASAIAGATGKYFQNGCATASVIGNVVTFVLDNCTGPLGLVAATGTVVATLSVQSSAVGVQLSGHNFTANGATMNLATVGTLTASNGQKTLTATTQTTGTGPNGNNASHSGMYSMVWTPGSGCATVSGTLTSTGSILHVASTQITNYVTCTGKCPQSGTSVSTFSGGTVMLTFNGSSTALCNASDGTSANLPLQCR